MHLKRILSGIAASAVLVSALPLHGQLFTADAADAKIEAAIKWAVKIAEDDTHGYSQENRQGPDYDCSSLVVNALKSAGIDTGGASYTGNMRSELEKHGFYWVDWSYIGGVSGLMRGDILLHRANGAGHTEIYLGNGQNVGAHSTHGHPEQGDQTGKEISVGAYWYDNWNGVLRCGKPQIIDNPFVEDGCFRPCAPGYTSIVEALDSIGADSSYSYRSRIAAVNGITGYSGSAAQNIQMLDMLKAGTLMDPDYSEAPEPGPISVIEYPGQYYPKCSQDFVSIVDALSSIGVDSSMANRKIIAAANGITGYSGTAEQNTRMLDLLKAVALINPYAEPAAPAGDKYYQPCDQSYVSIADALKSIGEESSLAYRKQIAEANGIAGYSGTAEQNTYMLSLLKSGQLIRAEWSGGTAAASYTVTLDANGGSSPIESMVITEGGQYTGLQNAVREGYSFEGWYTEKSGGTKVSASSALAVSADHTLYARWKANAYTISFENNDSSGITSDKSVTTGSKYGELPVPERTGYTFLGWYTDIAGGTKVAETTVFSYADNQTLYAHWKANVYTVSFDLNGGTGSADSISVTYDADYGTLPELKRTGYTFDGWFTEKSGGEHITSQTIVKTAASHKLWAHWTAGLDIGEKTVTLKNGDQYKINASRTGLTYKSNNTNVAVVSKAGVVTAVGEGNAVISVISPEGEAVQLKVTVISAKTEGDCNDDGEFAVSDAVMLQNWLIGKSSKLTDWKAADLHKDERIDTFDFVIMRRRLTGE